MALQLWLFGNRLLGLQLLRREEGRNAGDDAVRRLLDRLQITQQHLFVVGPPHYIGKCVGSRIDAEVVEHDERRTLCHRFDIRLELGAAVVGDEVADLVRQGFVCLITAQLPVDGNVLAAGS